ncbi:aspartate 1-decarboxylase [Anaerococcus marasmi]|uniref:aspartate 1-decarboxylase n=1 Tax=Anaerococcus marasmi TaxID=2057797 RepID=UPI000CF9770C|nr:aspartate 1-decarboxylase [Anaerococcus marasmi]
MNIEMLEGKIHRATVTEANLDYVGSITVDVSLLEESGIREYQKVQVVDVNNGNRIETYTIAGEKNSGVICLNGAAARLFSTGDKVIIMAYASYSEDELKDYKPKVVFVDDDNKITKISNYEKYGTLS